MTSIQTDVELLKWLYGQLIRSEPRIRATQGLLYIGAVVCAEICDAGCLARYDSDCVDATISDLLGKLAEPGEAIECGAKLIGWLETVYSGAISGGEDDPLSIESVIMITIELLGFKRKYLKTKRLDGNRLVESTARCERKFGIRVRVRLDDDASGSEPFVDVKSALLKLHA